ncbi:GTP:AMP phosphotransferase AK3, mitochondrial-like [Uloborus diversus]|uniref:GTP:AMP phosphotransferase AK3, mitochondrial-like n=1 Tax=Uloborus diversus TaxID=327109 RepID=UPI002409956B|nr:GTP:AMP phosphotransferase AK3, mitochondrial-like [Uloborus diversus]
MFFRAVIIGPPGCGKGTISSFIARDYKVPLIVCGDILREEIRNNTSNGKAAKKYLEKGHLVPDEVVSKLILDKLKTFEKKHWLMDGFPRNLKQAVTLSENYKISAAINIIVPDMVILPRLKTRWVHLASGRTYNDDFNPPKVKGKDDVTGEDLARRGDDDEEVVLERLSSFRSEIQYVWDFYRQKDLLKEFHGNDSPTIYSKIQEFLNIYFGKHGYPQ